MARSKDPRIDEKIVSAAADVLDAAGFGGFTVEAVAARARVHKSTIYARWSSGFELLGHLLARRLAVAPPQPAPGLRAALLEVATAEVAWATSRSGRALALLLLRAVDDPSVVADSAADAQRQRREAYRAFVHESAAGATPAHADDIDTTLDVLLWSVWGAVLWNASAPSQLADRLVAKVLGDAG